MAEYLHYNYFSEIWFARVAIIVILAVVISVAVRIFLDIAERVARRTVSVWEDALVLASRKPLQAVIWLIASTNIAEYLTDYFKYGIPSIVVPLRNVAVVLCLAWLLMRFISEYAARVVRVNQEKGVEVDLTTIDALSKLARLIVIAIVVLTVMQSFGISVSGLLAAGGIGGLAVGFAAKDLLANFFGGLTIYLDRPFSVGDWIRSPDKAIEGTVEHISWRHTRIRAFNKNPIYVPNALFTTIVVENPSRMTHRRIHETVGVRYDDLNALMPVVEDVKSMLRQHAQIDNTQTIIVAFNSFAPSSLDFLIYAYAKTTQWEVYHEVKQDILLRVAKIIERHGAQIAYPTRTILIESRAQPTAVS